MLLSYRDLLAMQMVLPQFKPDRPPKNLNVDVRRFRKFAPQDDFYRQADQSPSPDILEATQDHVFCDETPFQNRYYPRYEPQAPYHRPIQQRERSSFQNPNNSMTNNSMAINRAQYDNYPTSPQFSNPTSPIDYWNSMNFAQSPVDIPSYGSSSHETPHPLSNSYTSFHDMPMIATSLSAPFAQYPPLPNDVSSSFNTTHSNVTEIPSSINHSFHHFSKSNTIPAVHSLPNFQPHIQSPMFMDTHKSFSNKSRSFQPEFNSGPLNESNFTKYILENHEGVQNLSQNVSQQSLFTDAKNGKSSEGHVSHTTHLYPNHNESSF
jgi:hypothetical protein